MKMKINNKEFSFDPYELSDAENMEKALDVMGEREQKIKEMEAQQGKIPLSTVIRAVIDMFQCFFKEATGTDVLEECTNLVQAKEAYNQFLKEIEKAKKDAKFSTNRIH